MTPDELARYWYWVPDDYLNIHGAVGIHVYDLMTFMALIGGVAIWWWMVRSCPAGLKKKAFTLLVISLIAVVSARVFHILFYDLQTYLERPHLICRFGIGRSIHGVVAGFIIGAIVGARMLKVSIESMARSLSLWPLFGLAAARVGNFFNSEQVGTPSDVPWAVRFYYAWDHGHIPRHPVQLYEALWALLLAVVLAVLLYQKRRSGWLVPSLCLIGWSAGRFVTDFCRHAPGHLFGDILSTGQVLSIPFFLLGLYLLWCTLRFSKSALPDT